MKYEEKQLLIKDLSARLPYGVKINHTIYGWTGTAINFNRKLVSFAMEKDNGLCYDVPVEELLPYLRPLSSITEEEKKELKEIGDEYLDIWVSTDDPLVRWELDAKTSSKRAEFYNSHYLDWNGLIKKGLALEAPKDMYKTE